MPMKRTARPMRCVIDGADRHVDEEEAGTREGDSSAHSIASATITRAAVRGCPPC